MTYRVRKMRGRKGRIVYVCTVALTLLLNVAAWNSAAFSDWYIAHVFPIWVGTYGRVTGSFPFSVGEWMILTGLLVLALAVILVIVWAGLGIALRIRWWTCGLRYLAVLERFARPFYCFLAWVLAVVALIMTLNCFVLYHASTFSEQYFGEASDDYSLEELIAVYNMVTGECNRLAGVMERDEKGIALYRGGIGAAGEQLDMADMARELMRRLGEDYPQLDGYYPRPKALFSSDFMCQQYMQGYYFPFSMEANYNDVMHVLRFPATMCHELAHLRGYIYEDEANFIGYLACVESGDDFFRYAGYLSVLVYLQNDIYKARKENRSVYEKATVQIRPLEVEAQVREDNIFVSQEEWDRINGKALIDTEVVDKAADVFIDTNLKVNGVADGVVSYSRVVRLLLQYYRAKGSA